MSNDNQLKVLFANCESKCDECGEDLGRHYDELLLSMVERSDARVMVHDAVEEVLEQWELGNFSQGK